MFLQASVILLTGGEYLTGSLPGPGTPPPRDQVHPPGTRYTPPGPGTPPWDQVYLVLGGVYLVPGGTNPPGPGTNPQTRYKPPQTRYTPPSSACWEIPATSGRYASHWNAFFWFIILNKSISHFKWILEPEKIVHSRIWRQYSEIVSLNSASRVRFWVRSHWALSDSDVKEMANNTSFSGNYDANQSHLMLNFTNKPLTRSKKMCL